MEPGFHGHPYVAEQFIKAHAALQELAKFVQIIIKVGKFEEAAPNRVTFCFRLKSVPEVVVIYSSMDLLTSN